jgi:hypothetical protein
MQKMDSDAELELEGAADDENERTLTADDEMNYEK